ncbi:hypothetical protein [Glycomyces xiaoerkulensis]|uniref:hypothetical protein n=1 Tax=Glycomyces xiaoerkulensis TaxID=2038139 RepID=UPI000C25F423|nr:hypothetical protein [Glycomyces xiaoerkulensis]
MHTTLACTILYLPADYALELGLTRGLGAERLTITPGSSPTRPKLRRIVADLAEMLGLGDSLQGFLDATEQAPWKDVFDIEVEPSLTVEVDRRPSVLLVVKLYDGPTYGLRFPGKRLPSWITVEPDFTVYDLLVGYDRAKGGLELRARVEYEPQRSAPSEAGSARVAPGRGDAPPEEDRPGGKTQLVSFPLPLPDQGTPNFEVEYLGLGQKFGPTVEVGAEDPLKDTFDVLEKNLTSNDPVTVVRELADCFHPDRGWFVAADIRLRGWRVRALFNDPVLYGLEVTCASPGDPFDGFLFEILYQKLGPHLGVYYGALTIPEAFRRIDLGAVALTLPAFRIWIYTNGDFKVSVGWPLGPDSIGVAVAVFTGGGGFYFAKLRSGDDPNHAAKAVPPSPGTAPDYNPVLEFGLAVWLGLGRSIEKGPFSATLSLTLQGTFQGLLAWEAPGGGRAASLSRAPDYHWFAATVGIVGQLQGSIELKVIRISVLVRLSVTAGIAFESGYGTAAEVVARVHAEAGLTIVFVRISVSFDTTISETFALSTGEHGPASLNGPRNAAFQGMHGAPPRQADAPAVAALEPGYAPAPVIEAAAEPAGAPDAEPVDIGLGFLLHPSAVYRNGAKTGSAVALLTIACPPPGEAPAEGTTDWEKLVDAFAAWLLDVWAPNSGTWGEVRTALGEGRDLPPEHWDEALTGFLTRQVRFTVRGIDLTKEGEPHDAAVFPVFDAMRLTWDGGSVVFADRAPTGPGYVEAVDAYFEALSLRGTVAAAATADRAHSGQEGSVARFVFDDYFLLIARQLAHSGPENAAGKPEAGPLAGMVSRYLLHGLRLPDPDSLSTIAPEAGYTLTGQQFTAPDTATCTATLSIDKSRDERAAALRFDGGAKTATAATRMGEVPDPPHPDWTGPDVRPGARTGADTINVDALPAAHSEDTRYAQRFRSPWTEAGTTRFLVPLPPGVLAETARRPLEVTVSKAGETRPLPAAPVLTIPLRLHRVERAEDADATPRSAGRHVPFVYRVEGTDARTRARIHGLLEQADPTLPQQATVSLLYNAPTVGYRSDRLDPAEQPVTLTKTNLSTSNEPAEANVMFATAPSAPEGPDELGPTTATPDQTEDFLRLLWEVSTVHTGGFFLRYAAADGSDLPERIFASGNSADLTVAVTFAAEETPRFDAWHDSFAPALDAAYQDTLVLRPGDADGPIRVLAPSHPPGCVGFTAEWQRANELLMHEAAPDPCTPDWVASLYHLIQYRVSGEQEGTLPQFDASPWSSALSPTRERGPGERSPSPGGDPAKKDYRQIVPVSLFAQRDDDRADPYAAVGGRPLLSFRLNDVFGNELDSASFSAPFPVTYNDPLILPAEWPGAHCAYRFVPPGADAEGPALSLRLRFDPSHIRTAGAAFTAPVHGLAPGVEPTAGQRVAQQVEAAVARYDLVLAQLGDPRLSVALRTTVQPSREALADGEALRSELARFARSAKTELLAIAAGNEGSPVELDLPAAVDPADLAEAPENIVEIQTTLTFFRPPEYVYTDGGKQVPGSQSATLTVAADLDSPPARRSGAEGDAQDEARLRGFARDFESAFAGFDGDGGRARVAVTSDVREGAQTEAAPSTPALWAVRWSSTAGITVRTAEDAPSYFSLAPLSVHLASVTADVPAYDASLRPAVAERTFTGVDLDAWARQFLCAVDEVLSADHAPTVASLDADTYQEMMRAKSVLAQALAEGVQPVLEGQAAGGLAEARDRFEQSVLNELSSAYDISAVVQVPMRVTVKDTGTATRTRLFGSVVGDAPDSDGTEEASAFTTGTAKLPLRSTDTEPNRLSFPVTATEPHQVAHLPIRPAYRSRFLEREIPADHADHGYAPSQWLRIVLEEEPEPFDLPLGHLDVPVPSREHPPPFVLRGQKADRPAVTPHWDLADPLTWDYEADLVLPEWEAQDDLWFDVTYNLPVADDAGEGASMRDDREPPLAGLPEELAAFSVAWPQLRPHLAGLTVPGEATAPAPQQVITAVWNAVKRVTRAWAALRGIPDPWAPADGPEAADDAPPPEAPGPVKDSYVIRFADARRKLLHVYAKAGVKEDGTCDEASLRWPQINGYTPRGNVGAVCRPAEQACAGAPTPDPCWYRAEYRFNPPPGEELELTLEWTAIDVFSRQTAETVFWLVRNAHLSEDDAVETSAAFVYRTPEVGFVGPVSPVVTVDRAGPVHPGADVRETLVQALSPLATAGAAAYRERFIKAGLHYRYRLAGTDGLGLRGDRPVLLADHVRLATGVHADEDGATDLDTFAQRLSDNLQLWHRHARPSTAGATLSLEVTLFADIRGSRLPVVTVRDLEIATAGSWWIDT